MKSNSSNKNTAAPAAPAVRCATLPGGLRVVHEYVPSPVVYCGYVVPAGTRHEDAADAGMAHFIEHMSFKGTARRRAVHIANGLERVGGELNAFTGKQETVYCATVLKDDFARAADLLTDIVFGSTYPQHEIDKEVEVICDEIDSYRDSPAELIFDEFESMLFAGHPLGRDILGVPERLRQYTTADACRFARRHYRPAGAAFYVLGDVRFETVVRQLERQLALLPAEVRLPGGSGGASCDFAGLPEKNAGLPGGGVPVFPADAELTRVVAKDTHQAHVLLGAPAFAATDSRRYALWLLNNLLGGPGGNSRLNMSLRERAGLVYSVDASLALFPDAGYWSVYFGCDAADVARCRRLVVRELDRLVSRELSAAQLAAAKKQLCGQVVIGCDNRESYAVALGKSFAHYGTPRDVAAELDRLRGVTAAEVRQVAEEIYRADRLRTLVYR